MSCSSWNQLNTDVISCSKCERLVAFRQTLPKRKAFMQEKYWRKPTPGFGDIDASLLILGLAPSAHGGNRTGRIFTGDESARFLFHCLYQEGFANTPYSISRDDQLQLTNCYVTAAVKCVPPQNRPTAKERSNCKSFLIQEIKLLKNLKAVLVLGSFAYQALLSIEDFFSKEEKRKAPKFFHGAQFKSNFFPTIYCSYHPSPQNTYTKKLTEKMFIELLQKIKKKHSFS